MNTITTPAPARTDAFTPRALPLPATLSPTIVRLAGTAVAVLVGSFAVLIALPWPAGSTVSVTSDIGSLAFQLSTLILLFVMWRTHAVGEALGWRGFGAGVTVIVMIAMASGLTRTLAPSDVTLFATNLSWFIAMAGMFVLGVGVVARGRWRGPARYLPLAAHSWPLVALPVMVLTEDTQGQSWYVYITYLAVTQALLGLALAIRPQLTGARR
ncbi:hypothetical protein [Diaminobutyricimonas sp. LJ205]|uniref:hypothetical protein n=1 Tax=Diaminobutyricimonas sp. LJ205 TaxID=2683590 RepID=UPI0012F510F7|nr:hypothetical protein [Diaminobutyricimonas sp. LJ205]